MLTLAEWFFSPTNQTFASTVVETIAMIEGKTSSKNICCCMELFLRHEINIDEKFKLFITFGINGRFIVWSVVHCYY